MKIFISYSSKNQDFLHSFVERILQLGLNINPEDIYCTGIESSKPETGEDFKIWIKEKIKIADVIIQLISWEYKESEVCLNEMGASWVSGKKVFPLLIGDVDFNDVGFIHSSDQLAKLNVKKDILKFIDELVEIINISSIKTEKIIVQVEKFLNETDDNTVSIKYTIDNIPLETPDSKFKFFKRFIEPDVNVVSLFEKSQPNLYDCKQIFNEKFASIFYDFYNDFYLNFSESIELNDYDTFDIRETNVKQLKERNEEFPGGMSYLAKMDVFKPSVVFYSIVFLRKGEEFGYRFPVWCLINEKWVFIPKPWRLNIDKI